MKFNPLGMNCGKTYAYIMTMIPTIAASATECQKTNRKIDPSLPTWFVAAVAMQIDCASIIFPITPPALFVAHIRIGLRFSCCAVIFCKPPNSTFEDVSLPVSATPSQPINVPKNGKSQPVRLKSRPPPWAAGFCPPGVVRTTLLCKYGQSHPAAPGRGLPSGIITLNAGVVALFIANFTAGNPQTSTMTERIAKGSQALAV